ncbi:MAG: aspartate aminotransferase family protein, partial [Candidatus Bathyarchaeia archaeon]
MPLAKMKTMFERARIVTPGGVHSNIRYMDPNPLYFSRALGSRLWDVDGEEFIDCVVNFGACILGHAHPKVLEEVRNQLATGLTCGVETELSIRVSEKLNKMIPCAENVRFATTGTEAVMHCLMIARGYSGKDKILKIEGGFDGWYDSVLISSHPKVEAAGPDTSPTPTIDSAGIPKNAAQNTIVVPYNNTEVLATVVEKHKDELAAVIVEPVAFNMGCVLPKSGYLESVRKITEENDVLLIFDEVITGFRLAPGGAQEYFKVTPDLATFAKALANGFPLSAVAGRHDVMTVAAPNGKVAYMGTYNGSQSSLAAASATLDVLQDGRPQALLSRLTEKLRRGFHEICKEMGIPARFDGLGGQFQIYFTGGDTDDYRKVTAIGQEPFMRFQKEMLRQHILFMPIALFHHGISAAHTDDDVDIILNA